MIAKELLDHRWKVAAALALGLGTVVIGLSLPQRFQGVANPEVQAAIAEATLSYPSYVWNMVYNPGNGLGPVLLGLAALLGASLIAGELSRGTLFVLLSRPLTRQRILLTKYAVGAGLLLAVVLTLSLAVLALTAAAGQPQHLGGVLISALLLWLGSLFVLGVATLCSVIFTDVLRPLALTVTLTVLLVALPALSGFPELWVLASSWASFPAFLGQEFPLRQLVVSLIAALLPLLLALFVFRRQQY